MSSFQQIKTEGVFSNPWNTKFVSEVKMSLETVPDFVVGLNPHTIPSIILLREEAKKCYFIYNSIKEYLRKRE